PGEPTEVAVGLVVTDVVAISDLDQSVTLDVLLQLRWQDRRLLESSGCRFELQDLWNPEIQLINSAQLDSARTLELTVEPGGWVQGNVRHRGTVSNPHRMDEFPFDSHDIKLEFMPLRYSNEEVRFEVAEDRTALRPVLTIPDWQIGEPGARVADVAFPQLGRTVSVYEFNLAAARRAEYYLYKVILPLTMIVVMSWGIFWIDPNQLGPQISLASMSMLTLIAFQFTLNAIQPRVGYFTAMDQFTMSSSVLVFLALVEAVVSGRLAQLNKLDAARAADRASRWGFPLAYVVVVFATLAV
ncbi:MAG: hypothetical protein OES38_13620, partial [Gammaproteobacteria bacterium]|nr:hypothetical protein [Gammaproteobacteria bacterium]